MELVDKVVLKTHHLEIEQQEMELQIEVVAVVELIQETLLVVVLVD